VLESDFRVEANAAQFVVRTDEPEFADALRELVFQESGREFVRSFPSDSPDLVRIYERFSSCLEPLLLQTIRREPAPWDAGLLELIRRVNGTGLDWFLCGSAALAVRGLDVAPRDIDLVVDDAPQLGGVLDDVLIHPVVYAPGWIADWFGRAFLCCRIEWVAGVQPQADDEYPTETGPTAASRLETVDWEDHAISVTPLDIQLDVNERRGLDDRVEKIHRLGSS
jgi:hypothetical protein